MFSLVISVVKNAGEICAPSLLSVFLGVLAFLSVCLSVCFCLGFVLVSLFVRVFFFLFDWWLVLQASSSHQLRFKH